MKPVLSREDIEAEHEADGDLEGNRYSFHFLIRAIKIGLDKRAIALHKYVFQVSPKMKRSSWIC